MKTPMHLWIIGALSLLWNAGGAVDYVMMKFGVEAYTSQLTEEQLAFFDGLPAWYGACWAIGVWFSVIGSILLLLRSRWAVHAFGLSLLGLLATSIYSFFILDSSPMRDAGTVALLFTVAIYVVLVFLLIYSRAMAARGVLR